MSVDKFIVTKEDSGFCIIPHNVSQNLRDAEALGLWVYLQSLPPQWEFYKTFIRNHFGWGRDKLDKKIAILKAYNLVDIIGNRNEKGQFIEWNLHVKNGREFPTIQNTENPCTGDELSTESKLSTENDIQNTEKPAAEKPVTGFPTPIENTHTKEKAYREKSFCADEQKKLKSKKEWREENSKRPEWAEKKDIAAESKQQMDREAKHIEESNEYKRVAMPDSLRQQIRNMRC